MFIFCCHVVFCDESIKLNYTKKCTVTSCPCLHSLMGTRSLTSHVRKIQLLILYYTLSKYNYTKEEANSPADLSVVDILLP